MLTCDEMQIQIFLNTLFSGISGDYSVELRPITPQNNVRSEFFKKGDITKLVNTIITYGNQGNHCFIGILPREGNQRNDEGVKFVQTLWVDIDAKHNSDDKQLCLSKINEFPLKPTMIVDSGNGYHAYWCLREATPITGAEVRGDITKISKALHKTIGADSTFNLSRILRVPGTYNVKDPENPKMAKIIQMNLTQRYSLDELKNHVDVSVVEQEDSGAELKLDEYIGFKTLNELRNMVPHHILERAKTCPKELVGDRSANDFWVAIKLFETGLNDAEVLQAFVLFGESGWSAGEKVRKVGTDYLVKHTLPQAKLKAHALEKILSKISTCENSSDKYMYTDQALEHIAMLGAIEQQVQLKALHELLGGTKAMSITVLKNRLKYLKASQGPGRFFEISPAGAKNFVPHLLGVYLLGQDHFMYVNSKLFRYESGVFKDDGIEFVSQKIQSLLQDYWKTNYRDETIAWIQDKTRIDSEALDTYEYYINVKNGMLDVRTRQLYEHDPKYMSTVQLDVYYQPEKSHSRLAQFAEEIFNNDAIDTMWEFNGYILLGALELKKFVIFTGGGNNGKSIWLNIISEILGDDNVVNEPLQKLATNNFSTANLFGKIANINADLESEAVKYTGIIKMLTGGDRVAAEVKYGDTFYFKNRARLLFSCNELPTIHDYNDAFFDRLLVVNCPNQFKGSDCDPHLLDKLTTEDAKSAWLNLALDGIDRLLKNKKFTFAQSIHDDTLQYRYSNDTVAEFIQTNTLYSENDYITKDEMYEAYKAWCRSVGRYPSSLKIFTRRAKAAPNNLTLFHPKTGDKQSPCWKNITLTDIGKHKFLSSYDDFSIKLKKS